MKMADTAVGGLLRLAAAIIALLLVPVAASAHGMGDRLPVAGVTINSAADTIGAAFETDCMPPASGYGLHCHLVSVPSMAAGPNQSLDDDETVAAVPAPQPPVAQNFAAHSALAWHVPIAAPPRFILFGNFRS